MLQEEILDECESTAESEVVLVGVGAAVESQPFLSVGFARPQSFPAASAAQAGPRRSYMKQSTSDTGRRSPLQEKAAEHGGGMQPRREADRADDAKASTRWHELVSELAKPALSQTKAQPIAQNEAEQTAANQNSPPRSSEYDSQKVLTTLEKAVQAAKADSQWSASGLPESLQRTVQLCSSEGPDAAKTAALGLLDFHQMVKNSKLRSPKTPSPPVSPEREEDRQGSKQGDSGNKDLCFLAAS